MSGKENSKGCLPVLIIFLGAGFLLMLAETLLGFLFGGKSFISEFLDPDNDGTNLDSLRFVFWALVVIIVLFFISGGKIDDIFGRKE